MKVSCFVYSTPVLTNNTNLSNEDCWRKMQMVTRFNLKHSFTVLHVHCRNKLNLLFTNKRIEICLIITWAAPAIRDKLYLTCVILTGFYQKSDTTKERHIERATHQKQSKKSNRIIPFWERQIKRARYEKSDIIQNSCGSRGGQYGHGFPSILPIDNRKK